jgi:acid phosphatase (class A)
MRAARAFAAVVVLVLTMTSPAALAKDHGELYYLPQKTVDLAKLLAGPPEDDSKLQEADARKISQILLERTPADMAQAALDAHRDIFVFTNTLGPNFDAAHTPLTSALFAHADNDTEILIDLAKAHFLRHRPPGTKQTHFSYPSGHSAFAACAAILLSDMVPEKRGQIFARASIFAESRLIAGVHYPTDVEAGWISGTVIAQALMMQPKFQADFTAAKVEVRSALGLPLGSSK